MIFSDPVICRASESFSSSVFASPIAESKSLLSRSISVRRNLTRDETQQLSSFDFLVR